LALDVNRLWLYHRYFLSDVFTAGDDSNISEAKR